MALVLNGSGTITGLSAGGLPDGAVTADDLASTLDLTGKTVSLAAGGTGYGKVLQVVQTATTTNTATTSTSYVDTSLTASITPTSATSKVLVLMSPNLFTNRNGVANPYGDTSFNILRGATEIHFERVAINFGVNTWSDYTFRPSVVYLDSPSTTSSTTYKMQIKVGVAGTQVQNNVSSPNYGNSTIVLMEIAA